MSTTDTITVSRPVVLTSGRTIPAGTTLRRATPDEETRVEAAVWLLADPGARAYVFDGAVILLAR